MLKKKSKKNFNSGSMVVGLAVGSLTTGAAMLFSSEVRNKVKNTSKNLYWKANSLRGAEKGTELPADPYVEETEETAGTSGEEATAQTSGKKKDASE